MRPASDPNKDYIDLVRRGYNQCAKPYLEARQDQPPKTIELLTRRLPNHSKVLDLGCGAGIPITRALAKHHEVLGVDFSQEQINLARTNVPAAQFVCKSILELDFPEKSYDAITAFYVLFHLPREKQWDAIRLISRWLRAGGYFLATLSNNDIEPYTEDDFFGTTMYWNDLPIEEHKTHIEAAGLRIIFADTLGHGYSYETREAEIHPIVLAQKQ
jgi:SAM-dependent methyltransferase